jgi:hypothetical protein
MRTTVDIPDELFRRAKSEAALSGRKLKDLMLHAGFLPEPDGVGGMGRERHGPRRSARLSPS